MGVPISYVDMRSHPKRTISYEKFLAEEAYFLQRRLISTEEDHFHREAHFYRGGFFL